MADCVVSDKKAKQAKLRLPLTYKRLIVWDIYGPLYVIGKRKQQGSSNFAPRQTSPRGIFSDDQSAFTIPLGINEKKRLRGTHQVQTSMIAVTIWHHILLFPVIMGFIVKEWYFYVQDMVHFTNWNSDRNWLFSMRNFWRILNESLLLSVKANGLRIVIEFFENLEFGQKSSQRFVLI